MENAHAAKLDSTLEVGVWGVLLMWWGVTEIVSVLPPGTGILGVGLILLGLNLIRALNGIPTRGLTTIVGVLALIWGGLELVGGLLPFDVPVFGILLIVLGIMVVAPVLAPAKAE